MLADSSTGQVAKRVHVGNLTACVGSELPTPTCGLVIRCSQTVAREERYNQARCHAFFMASTTGSTK
jgi:hypothetical protein